MCFSPVLIDRANLLENDVEKELTADTLIREGVDEFRMAAASTATGIIQMGQAVLKIKEGCNKKQGGSDFTETVMRELGLKEAMANYLARIGKDATKLLSVERSLPAESVKTIYTIAKMDDDVIADKIERGIIHPGATVNGVREVKRVDSKSGSREVTSKDPEVIATMDKIVKKLNKKEKDALSAEFTAKVKVEVDKAKKEAMQIKKEASEKIMEAEKLRSTLTKARRILQYPLSMDEYRLIRGMLHPDKHPNNSERANQAYQAFTKIEPICKKAKLSSVK